MSELMNASAGRHKDLRWHLLATVSSLALLGFVYGADRAQAADDDADRPTVWIELGGQLERVDGGGERFAPPFVASVVHAGFTSPVSLEKPPLYSNGAEGKITFEPAGTDWVLSVSVRYGRSNNGTSVHKQTNPTKLYPAPPPFSQFIKSVVDRVPRFSETDPQNSETHAVIDFQAGKDVGLGMFGNGGSSILDLGVRYAQFASNSKVTLKADPDSHVANKYFTNYYYHHIPLPVGVAYHSYAGKAVVSRSFRGIGPSISWNASAPVVGHPQESKIALDWGLNAALLFGRQKANVHHQTTARYHKATYASAQRNIVYQHTPPDSRRAQSVIVPNVGGFAGLTFRHDNAKVSFGYRGDFFFGAMDGGIDVRKTYDRNFYGPFATISIKLGG